MVDIYLDHAVIARANEVFSTRISSSRSKLHILGSGRRVGLRGLGLVQ
jgi:hypothetical protein